MEIIKCRGINNKNKDLNYNSFLELFKGKSLYVKQLQFKFKLNSLEVGITEITKEIKGIDNKEIKYKIENRQLIVYNGDMFKIVKIKMLRPKLWLNIGITNEDCYLN
jgi:hypothetical protein